MQADKDGFLVGAPIGGGDSDRLLGAIKGDTGKILAAMRQASRGTAATAARATVTPAARTAAGRVAVEAAASAGRAAARALPAASRAVATPVGRAAGGGRARDAAGRFVAADGDSASPAAAQGLAQVAAASAAFARTAEAERRQNKADQAAQKRGKDGRFGAGEGGRGGEGGRLGELGAGAGAAIEGGERIDPLLGAVGEVKALAGGLKNIASPIGRALGMGRGSEKSPEVGWLKRMWRELRGMRKDRKGGGVAAMGGGGEDGGILGMVMSIITGPVGALIAAGIAGIAGWFTGGGLYKWFDSLNLGEKFSQAWNGAASYIGEKWDAAVKFVSDTFEPARKLFSDLSDWVSHLPGMEAAKNWVKEGIDKAGAAIDIGKKFASDAVDTVKSGAGGALEAVKSAGGEALNWAGTKIGKKWDANKGTLVSAAQGAGVDPGLMAQVVGVESGFDPTAQPRRKDGTLMSSAHGFGQMLDGTWVDTVRKHGEKYGVSGASRMTKDQALALRSDPGLQAKMLAELTAENVAKGRQLGGSDDAANVYAMHNLGAGDGSKFLRALRESPDTNISSVLGAKAIANNPLFYKGGKATVGEAYASMSQEMARKSMFADDARSLASLPSAMHIAASPPPITVPPLPASPAPVVVPPMPSFDAGAGTRLNSSAPAAAAPAPMAIGQDVRDRTIAHIASGGIGGVTSLR